MSSAMILRTSRSPNVDALACLIVSPYDFQVVGFRSSESSHRSPSRGAVWACDQRVDVLGLTTRPRRSAAPSKCSTTAADGTARSTT